MSLLSMPNNDFSSFMVADWGKVLVITHITDKTLNPGTGDYTLDSDSESITGIEESITERDIAIFPNLVKTTDKIFRINKDDLAFVPVQGDTITVNSVSYTVVETKELDSLMKIFSRKH